MLLIVLLQNGSQTAQWAHMWTYKKIQNTNKSDFHQIQSILLLWQKIKFLFFIYYNS
jgi:hypothetical protein